VIRVILPPLEILLLRDGFRLFELTILVVLLAQVHAVRAIFVVVPRTIVAAFPIVVLLFAVLLSHYRHWVISVAAVKNAVSIQK